MGCPGGRPRRPLGVVVLSPLAAGTRQSARTTSPRVPRARGLLLPAGRGGAEEGR